MLRIRDGLAALRSYSADILVGTGLVLGWALVTWGIGEWVGSVAWRISGGLFLLSLCGWKWMWVLFRDGLYVLTRSEGK